MRPNKVETAVQCSLCRMWVFAGFSGHGNLNGMISIPLLYICGFLGNLKLVLKKRFVKTEIHFIAFNRNIKFYDTNHIVQCPHLLFPKIILTEIFFGFS